MADQIFSKIQLPNSDKAWYKYGIYPVIGTQTANTQHWTGNIDVPALYDGLTIAYYLPRDGVSSKNVDLNLTLKDGTTTTGAIDCYNTNNSRITTHYGAGATVILTYWSAGSISINGTATTVATWRHANSDSNSNTYDRTYHNGAIKAKTAIAASNLIVGDSGGYWHLKAGIAFDITYPLLYASAKISAGATATNTYIIIPFAVATTQALTMVAYKALFIKGTLNGTLFTPISTAPLTQDIPTTEDGYQYMYVGDAYSTASAYLMPDHPIYEFKDGAFRLYGSTDNNTIYTFTDGTNGFTVTPSGGTAQTVTVTPSIANNITGSGTSGKVAKFTGTNTIGDGYDVDTTVTSGSGNLITSGAVYTAIDNLPEPMIFKGTLGTGGTITSLPAAAAANEGFTYKVITAGTYASIAAKVGDVFVSNGSSWVLIPAGDTDSDTWRNIKVNGIEKLGTGISTGAVDFVNGTNTTVSFNATGNKISINATDTKNTTGSTDTSSKIYLVGATSQDVNPQTYSDNEIYATSGVLTTKSVQVGGSAATIQFNSTDNSIEFIFN